jgi:Tol biopolymer transport system component
LKKNVWSFRVTRNVLLAILFATLAGSVPRAVGQEKELRVWPIPTINEGAEFYFSPDGQSLIGNAKMDGDTVHHVYTFRIDGTNIVKINGEGEDACSYFMPDGKHVIFTSTRDNPSLARGNFSDPNNYPQGAELYTSGLDGKNVKRLTSNLHYDAEVSASPDGSLLLFTRQIDGMLDLWTMRPDGSDQKQITHTPEWQEGGSFFLDSKTIIYRAWERKNQGQRGMPMNIFTVKTDGTGLRRITNDDGTNWAPFPAPDGEHFVFVKVLPPHNYEIFLMSMKTGKQTRLTYSDAFDGFPALSPDGKLLTFDSNRDAKNGEKKLRPYLMDISSLHLGPKQASH